MKRLYITKRNFLMALVCFAFFVVLMGNANVAESATLVVDNVNPSSNCVDGGSAYTTIQLAVNAAVSGDIIKVCPGTYTENVDVTKSDLTIESYSGDPSNTIVLAADPNDHVFYNRDAYPRVTISGFRIEGATGAAGIFLDCANNAYISNNIITGNYYGIRAWNGVFYHVIKDNRIYNNQTGISLDQYGRGNTIVSNNIHDNSTDIEVLNVYSLIEEEKNVFYHNNIINNPTTQVYDDHAADNNWHHPTLLEGNYWSDYTGADDGSGTGKHAIAGDGIGDTEIPHPGPDYDNYPFVNPFPESWQIEIVDEVGDVGLYTSIDLDSSNNPHICYYDATNGNLKYAYYDGASWYIETVDSGGDVGKYCSLALDTSDRAHISYYDVTNGDLKYAKKTPGTGCTMNWACGPIDTGGTDDVGRYTSIVSDSLNKLHISYNTFQTEDAPSVRIVGDPTEYYSLQDAYNAAADGSTIQSQAISFTENLDINLPKSVTLEGGYDCNYTATTGETTLNGTITISDGTVTIGNFVLE